MSVPNQRLPQTSLSTPRWVVSPWFILISIALGFFMILLDTTVVNVAIPSMIDGLHASLDQILWVLNAYILVYAVLLITAGRLGDMFGPKRLFLSGLVLFVLASAACGLAQSPDQLILFRVIQAVGGALLTPQSMSIITSIFPPEKRGGAFGLWAAVAGVAAAAGPTLGGFLTTSLSWRAIFYINVPIGIIAVILVTLVMPEVTIHRQHRLDMLGVGLASLGLFAAVFGLIEGQRYNWGPIDTAGSFSLAGIHASIISVPTILAAAVVLIAAFVLYETTHIQAEPLLPVSLFRERNFSVANLISATVAFGMLGLFFTFTIYLQTVLGMKAENAGVVMVPSSLTSLVVAPIAGRLSDKGGYGKWILSGGLILFAVGMGLVIYAASLTSTGISFTPPLIVAGIGMGCMFAPMVTLAMRNVSPAQAGSASGFINTIRQVGGAMGTAVIGAVLATQLASRLTEQARIYAAQLPSSARPAFIQGFAHAGSGGLEVGRGQTGAAVHLPPGTPAALRHQIEHLGTLVYQHAYLLSMKTALTISIVVLLFGALVTAALIRGSGEARGQRAEQPEQPHEPGIAVAGE